MEQFSLYFWSHLIEPLTKEDSQNCFRTWKEDRINIWRGGGGWGYFEGIHASCVFYCNKLLMQIFTVHFGHFHKFDRSPQGHVWWIQPPKHPHSPWRPLLPNPLSWNRHQAAPQVEVSHHLQCSQTVVKVITQRLMSPNVGLNYSYYSIIQIGIHLDSASTLCANSSHTMGQPDC